MDAWQQYGLKLVTAGVEPVSVDDFKLSQHIDHDDEDDLIESYLIAARQYVEKITRRQFTTATWRLSLDEFPCDAIVLPLSPVQSVTSITYVDDNGTTQTWSSANYLVDTHREPTRITPAYSVDWPSSRPQASAVLVTFVAGSGNASTVSELTKRTIMLLAAHWFENREPIVTDMTVRQLPHTLDAMLTLLSSGTYP